MLIDRNRLKVLIPAIAGKMKFRPAIVEKDYYITVILSHVKGLLSDKLVFKGGTLLNKAYLNYHRLSEDLDFTYISPLTSRAQRSKAIEPIRKKMASFLNTLGLTSDNPEGEGFNNSRQYVFVIKYYSIIMNKEDTVKFEISLRQFPIDSPVEIVLKHFYQDPFTGEDIFPHGSVLSLSWKESVAEKLKAAITRREVAIRDFYDLWHISETGFDFYDRDFVRIFKKKLSEDNYSGDYSLNFGRSDEDIYVLRRQVEDYLKPVIREGEEFNLDEVLERFNSILRNI